MATPWKSTGAASTSSAATTSIGQLANVRTTGTSGVAPMSVSTPGDALGGRGALPTSGTRSDGSDDGASTTNGRSAVPRVSSSKARRDAIVAGVPGHMPPVWLLAELFTGADFFSTLVPSGREVDAVPTQCLVVVCSLVGCVSGCVFSPARRPAVVPSVRIYIAIVECPFVHATTTSRDSSSIRAITSCAVTAAAGAGSSPPLPAKVLVLDPSLKVFPPEARHGLAPPPRPFSRHL